MSNPVTTCDATWDTAPGEDDRLTLFDDDTDASADADADASVPGITPER